MAESNRRRLERLEQLATRAMGPLPVDLEAWIAVQAEILDAQIRAFQGTCSAHANPKVWEAYGPASSRARMQAEHQRFKMSEPLAIKERFQDLQQLAQTHGTTPAVRQTLVRARDFLNGAA